MNNEKLKEIVRLSGLSQQAFAAKFDISYGRLLNWLDGRTKIPLWAQKNIEREFFSPEGIQKPPENPELETLIGKMRSLLIDDKLRSTIEWIVDTYTLAYPEPPAQDSLPSDPTVDREYSRIRQRINAPTSKDIAPGKTTTSKEIARSREKKKTRP